MLFLVLSILAAPPNKVEIQVSPAFGQEILPVKVRMKLPQPTERSICVWFRVDGIDWRSCFDGEPDRLFYERIYKLDAGNYELWVSTQDFGMSEKRPVTVIASGPD